MREHAPPAYHVLVKPTGAICNLDCKYCFFLSKEALYPGSRFRMSDEALEAYVEQLFASHRAAEVAVAWQGGEPTLMGLEFFKRSVDLVEKHRRPEQHVTYTIQTNGTTLDDAWCAFFKAHGFLVGLSVDGPREMHNAYRVDKGGKGSFDQVMRGWECLKKHQVDCNILCTVHAANAGHPLDVYRFFRDELGAEFIQFIPVVERMTSPPNAFGSSAILSRSEESQSTQAGNQATERSVKPRQFGQFMVGIFDEWVQRDVGRVYVQYFDTALANWVGVPAGVCVFSPTCGLALALEHNGDLYSCDHFVATDYLLGNIMEMPMIELVTSEKQRQFGQDKQNTLPKYCRECEVHFACHGGCPKDRFIETPDGEPGLNYLCAGYKLFFHHIDRPMKIMANLLRQGRYADEVMQMYATGDVMIQSTQLAAAGRNAPCPCGSGKKYKHCHGPKEAV